MSHLTHLRTFLEVYRRGSISQAAASLGITQPTASLHLQALEMFVGKPLFERQARGVAATAAADELARSVAPQLDSLESKLASYRPGQSSSSTVHIAGPADFIYYRLADSLTRLMNGDNFFRLQTGNKTVIYQLLESCSIDLAVTASVPDEHQFSYAHLLTERMLLVCSPAVADRLDSLNSQSLMRVPLIAYDEDLPLIRQAWVALFQQSPELKATFTVPDMRTIKQMIISGHGWSVLPDYHCQQELQEGRLVALTSPDKAPANNLCVVWDKRGVRDPAVARVRDHLLQTFRQ
ncbi:LysR family transcriptional regulator [Tatumella citrea]|uniref:LysR family transcriptional regulator n=1 Tax=Tatumella citrea TaxID=53336 RepID=A0A1Y0LLY8_TATCI|nr:LysR family transcriptional regulator [Tatumella citrea]ARU94479.1 LysR family transcriptional regulator [Tatumella citrea]ARU98518.1 LysR family transcriptional regulator [Tatumella citrea]